VYKRQSLVSLNSKIKFNYFCSLSYNIITSVTHWKEREINEQILHFTLLNLTQKN
jgi:hypothetical protein